MTALVDLGRAQRALEAAVGAARKGGQPITQRLIAELTLKAAVAHDLPTRSWKYLEAWALTNIRETTSP